MVKIVYFVLAVFYHILGEKKKKPNKPSASITLGHPTLPTGRGHLAPESSVISMTAHAGFCVLLKSVCDMSLGVRDRLSPPGYMLGTCWL